MRKFLLCLVLIALVASTEITKRPPLTDKKKKKLVRDALNELAEKLANDTWEDILNWMSNDNNCYIGLAACEIAFPEYAWLCSIAFSNVC